MFICIYACMYVLCRYNIYIMFACVYVWIFIGINSSNIHMYLIIIYILYLFICMYILFVYVCLYLFVSMCIYYIIIYACLFVAMYAILGILLS